MKKIVFLTVAVFSFFVSFAQTSIKTKNENFKIPRIYIGVLSNTAFFLVNAGVSSSASLRIGGELSYQLNSKLSLNSFIANEISKDKNLSIASFYLKYHFSDKINLQIGQLATPATLFRPHSVSADGQFESWSTSQLPKIGLGATLSFFHSKFGVYKKGDNIEFHFYQKAKNITFATWINTNGMIGMANSYKKGRVNTTLSFIGNTMPKNWKLKINNLFVYTLDKNESLFLYSDMGYETEANEFIHLQLGVLKYFSTQYMKCMVGGAYDYTSKNFNGYLQFNL